MGPGARRLAPNVAPAGLDVIELAGHGEAGFQASWQAALTQLSGRAYTKDVNNPSFSAPTGRSELPRTDLAYGTPRWVGTSGDRAVRPKDTDLGKPSPDYLKLFLPSWVANLSGRHRSRPRSRPRPTSSPDHASRSAPPLRPSRTRGHHEPGAGRHRRGHRLGRRRIDQRRDPGQRDASGPRRIPGHRDRRHDLPRHDRAPQPPRLQRHPPVPDPEALHQARGVARGPAAIAAT